MPSNSEDQHAKDTEGEEELGRGESSKEVHDEQTGPRSWRGRRTASEGGRRERRRTGSGSLDTCPSCQKK